MAASATVKCRAKSSRQSCVAEWRKDLCEDKALLSTQASSRLTPIVAVRCRERNKLTGVRERARARAVRDYLIALHKINRSTDESENESCVTHPPKSVSLTDPAARWAAAPGGPAFFAYSTNYLIDLNAGIILDLEATPANRAEEVGSTKTMIERVEQRFAIGPQRLVGETAYDTAPLLRWMVDEKQIAPHVPVWDKVRRDGTFEREEFVWDARNNEYRCPAGHPMRSDWRAYTNPRTHARSIHEDARDVARRLAKTPVYRQSRYGQLHEKPYWPWSTLFSSTSPLQNGKAAAPTVAHASAVSITSSSMKKNRSRSGP